MQKDEKSKDRDVKPGDLVYVQTVKPPHPSPKLYKKWKGPMRVEGIAGKSGSGNVHIIRGPQSNILYNFQ